MRQRPELCDACGAVLTDGCAIYASLPDSSAIHPTDAVADGQRQVAACSTAHLAQLGDEYARRPFLDEELWAAKIDRALAAAGANGLPAAKLANATGLTRNQIDSAIHWRNRTLRRLHRRRAR